MSAVIKTLRGLAFGALLFPSALMAQEGTQSAVIADEEIATVFVFNRVCYAQVPAVQSIRNMAAQLGWQPLTGDDLEPFRTSNDATSLDGWDAQIGERVYRVGLQQGPVGSVLAEAFPDFANGVATSCTLVLDGLDAANELKADLQNLAGKAPVSEDVADRGLLTTSWAGGNADVKVFLVLKTNLEQAGNLINVVVVTKP